MASSQNPAAQWPEREQQEEKAYTIPLRYRKMENLHIVFWLLKDVSWCLLWRPLGIAMIFPTVFFSILITIRTRQVISEACHNLAVTLWIIANAYWMVCEFFEVDGAIIFSRISLGGFEIFRDVTYKHMAVIPFTAGILVLGYYYFWWKPRHGDASKTM